MIPSSEVAQTGFVEKRKRRKPDVVRIDRIHKDNERLLELAATKIEELRQEAGFD